MRSDAMLPGNMSVIRLHTLYKSHKPTQHHRLYSCWRALLLASHNTSKVDRRNFGRHWVE